MIGSWEKEGTLREVHSVAPVGQSCVLACIPECVPGHTHCYEVLSRAPPPLQTWNLHSLFTPSSKLAGISEGSCAPSRQDMLD